MDDELLLSSENPSKLLARCRRHHNWIPIFSYSITVSKHFHGEIKITKSKHINIIRFHLELSSVLYPLYKQLSSSLFTRDSIFSLVIILLYTRETVH